MSKASLQRRMTTGTLASAVGAIRLRMHIHGLVQGVGFRPFVYRLARELALAGWVRNSPRGVSIEVEGPLQQIAAFQKRLTEERPPLSTITRCCSARVPPLGEASFVIRDSDVRGRRLALVLPDIATCAACRAELFEPSNRRYLYPFTNCTHCGPRYSIITGLPYDRANTTMRSFVMCPACRREYEDPADRRFHAQPNACPDCGPQLALWDGQGHTLATRHQALQESAAAVRAGGIVAVKGLGGFHLVAHAGIARAVDELRRRKHRDKKPLALMFPTIEQVDQACVVSVLERQLLQSPAAPIVLLRRRDGGSPVARTVAPGHPCLGVMLPYTPLHHVLLSELHVPVVATSGNLSDEPMCIDEHKALRRLRGIADLFLVHDRPIHRHVDDSVARIAAGGTMLLRRARGYAPAALPLNDPGPAVLAVGGHLKNTVALADGASVFISPHIGDLETAPALEAFERTICGLTELYGARPAAVACDLHPDYLSSRHAARSRLRVEAVQHHHAHVVACMAEHDLRGTVLGVSWDGTGYGPDGTAWGGEFLLADRADYRRAAHFRQFRLPGGDRAVIEPRRAALGVLYELFGSALAKRCDLAPVAAFTPAELGVLLQMLARGVNAPQTSSVGRLFDAVASLAGLCQHNEYEGQAAMQLQFQENVSSSGRDGYGFCLLEPGVAHGPLVIDWEPAIRAIIGDLASSREAPVIASRFHRGLVDVMVSVARRCGEQRVVLTGGCFQNDWLLEAAIDALQIAGFEVFWPQLVPCNDGGIALGQVAAARARWSSKALVS
jgi:hydrogenase maturation protein HypF